MIARRPLLQAGTLLSAAIIVAAGPCSPSAGAWAQATYESRRTASVLRREGLRCVDAAEGRSITFVRIVRDDVFLKHDGGLLGWLTWANAFHWLTRQEVVRRELLLAQDDAYEQEAADESMRNLRDLAIFSYVRIVPVERESDHRFGLLVYTRDLWSLRLEESFQVTGATVDNLAIQLSERNLFGRQKRGTLRFLLDPDTFRLGQAYFDHRLAGGSLSLTEAFDGIFNRGDGSAEGLATALVLKSPFYDLDQRIGFDARATFITQVERELRDGRVVPFDIPETPEHENIARVWRQREVRASARLLYRRGDRHKQTFGVGVSYQELSAGPNEETGLMAGQAAAFREHILPRQRRQIGPILTYELFTPTFETFENLASFGVSETVRSGPHVETSFGFPLAVFGSSSDSVLFEATYGYVFAGHDFLADLSLSATGRYEDGDIVDQRLSTQLRGATPMVGPLRLVWRFTWDARREDTSREFVTLGGDNGLRGFVSQAFSAKGGNLLRGNLELRSTPFVLWSVHFGAVLFYDVGTVYEHASAMELHQAVGLGLRILFPQFNRLPFRVDGGLPLENGHRPVPSIGASQAVPLTELEDRQSL